MKVKVSIIVLNAVIIAYLLTFPRQTTTSYEPLRYETALPRLEADAIGGGHSSINAALQGRYGIIFYCHEEIPWQKVYYPRILLSRYGSHGDGLRAFLVVHQHLASQAPELARELGYPVVVDADDEIREALHLAHGASGAFIVSPDGKLKLVRNGIPSRDELRQHVEKHLLGEIFYEPSIVARLGPSMELPTIEATDVGSGRSVKLRPDGDTIYVVFTAALCSSCNTEPYYDQLERLVALARRWSDLRDKRIELLLTASYPVEEVAFELGDRGLDLAVYRATDTLRGLEDDYFTKRTSEADVLVAGFDGTGKVSFLEPIGEALDELEKEEEDHAA